VIIHFGDYKLFILRDLQEHVRAPTHSGLEAPAINTEPTLPFSHKIGKIAKVAHPSSVTLRQVGRWLYDNECGLESAPAQPLLKEET
jgi:hypothetical protein